MNMDPFFGHKKIMCSAEAEEGAKNLIERLESGSLLMDVLPNRYARFSGELEEKDYVSYCRFLGSANGKKVLGILEEEDATEFFDV